MKIQRRGLRGPRQGFNLDFPFATMVVQRMARPRLEMPTSIRRILMNGSKPKAIAIGWILLALAVSAIGAGSAFAQKNGGRETVAILAFDSVGASPAEASSITDRLQDLLLGTNKFQVVDRARIDAVFKEQAFQQTGCTSTECAIQVGKVLGVRKLVTGKITKLDETHWLISASLIDVESAETLKAPSLLHEGRFFEFLQKGVPILASRLAADTEPAPAPRAAVAAAPQKPPPATTEEPRTGPKQGFAVAVGAGSTSGTYKPSVGASSTYAFRGVALEVDYQWRISDKFSVLALASVYGGSVEGDAKSAYNDGTSTGLGGEVRYWIGQAFVGGLLTTASTILKDTKTNHPSVNASGGGAGIVGGYEWLSGWHVFVSLESASLSGKTASGPTTTSTSFSSTESRALLMAGYRF
jgi:hypothetical protein